MSKNICVIMNEAGYKPYRLIFKSNWNQDAKKQADIILNENKESIVFKSGDLTSNESVFYVPTTFNYTYLTANFNTMKVGGIDTIWVKDNDFKKIIVFGLHEKGMPPTLIGNKHRSKMPIEKIHGVYKDACVNKWINNSTEEEKTTYIKKIHND